MVKSLSWMSRTNFTRIKIFHKDNSANMSRLITSFYSEKNSLVQTKLWRSQKQKCTQWSIYFGEKYNEKIPQKLLKYLQTGFLSFLYFRQISGSFSFNLSDIEKEQLVQFYLISLIVWFFFLLNCSTLRAHIDLNCVAPLDWAQILNLPRGTSLSTF